MPAILEERLSEEREAGDAAQGGSFNSSKVRRPSYAEQRRSSRALILESSEAVDAATSEADEAQRQAQAAAMKALVAQAEAARHEWEQRAMAFLAAGNARMQDGTPVSDWLKVQDELKQAQAHGVPLSDAARHVILKMGTAEKAIKMASASAKAAAAQAAREEAESKRGRLRRARTASEEFRAEEKRKKADEAELEALMLAQEAVREARWTTRLSARPAISGSTDVPRP